jgi:pimeloyl-ACP methyl ester carboxylesterase
MTGNPQMDLIIDIAMNGAVPEARLTVPGERLMGKRLINLAINPPDVQFTIPTSGEPAPFQGSIAADSLAGRVSMGERSMELLLRRTGDVPVPPYREEDITFANGNVNLEGSLLLPTTPGPHPAVVLIHGSSTPDRDDFRFYADLFVRHGIASLIYDKRPVGSRSGGMSQVDLRDLAGDAAAAVRMLRNRSDIDPKRVGLWGHSQGGWVAPIAASQVDSVAFVVGFSAPGVTYADQDKFANASLLRANGFPASDIEQAMTALRQVDEFVRHGGNRSELQAALDSLHRRRWASFTTLPRLVPTETEKRSWIRWRNLDLDPADYWRRIRSPVLLLFGERDDVVPVEISARRIRDALRQAGNPGVVIRIFPGENHTIASSTEFLDVMVAWMVTHTTNAD